MIYLGADHGGYQLKEKIKSWLIGQREKYEDLGAVDFNANDDYPAFAFAVAEAVAKNEDKTYPWLNRAKGILFCRSGAGMVIAANKIKGVRAAMAYDTRSAQHSRLHNDINILVLPADWISEQQATDIVKAFLTTEFSKEERHARRLGQIVEKESAISN